MGAGASSKQKVSPGVEGNGDGVAARGAAAAPTTTRLKGSAAHGGSRGVIGGASETTKAPPPMLRVGSTKPRPGMLGGGGGSAHMGGLQKKRSTRSLTETSSSNSLTSHPGYGSGIGFGTAIDKTSAQLFAAAGAGKLDEVRRLLATGKTDTAWKDGEHGNTALHVASGHGHVSIIKELVDVFADPAIKNRMGGVPLHVAAMNGHTEAVRALLDIPDIVVDAHNKDGRTPLHVAASRGHSECIRLLVDAGAELEGGDRFGYTALHRAANAGQIEAVRLLLDLGASVVATNREGKTPADIACYPADPPATDEDKGVVRDILAKAMDAAPGAGAAARAGGTRSNGHVDEGVAKREAEDSDTESPTASDGNVTPVQIEVAEEKGD